MDTALDIEHPDALRRYLQETGRVPATVGLRCTPLAGGVSNRTVRVEWNGGPAWVIKQALARLRVKDDWFADPRRVHREALGLRWLGRLAPPGHLPGFVFEDETHHLLAMEAVPEPHENWKSRLLTGRLDAAHVRQFAELLATLHRRSHEQAAETAAAFADRSFFETLRLEPYYRFAAHRQSAAAPFFDDLIAETLATRLEHRARRLQPEEHPRVPGTADPPRSRGHSLRRSCLRPRLRPHPSPEQSQPPRGAPPGVPRRGHRLLADLQRDRGTRVAHARPSKRAPFATPSAACWPASTVGPLSST
ncbi:MAG: hypothetical protein M5U12_17850 [Verrucomicrobia bacterium]|nr:hypothetical protein [Verrucomicrobiota bacterium]